MNGRFLIGFFLALIFASAIGLGTMPGNLLVDMTSEFAFVAAVIGLVAADAVTLLNSIRAEGVNVSNWSEGLPQSDPDNSRPTVLMSSLLPQGRQTLYSSQGTALPEHSDGL